MNPANDIQKLTTDTGDLIRVKLTQFESMWREMYVVDNKLLNKYYGAIYTNIESLFIDLEKSIIEKKSRLLTGIDEQLIERSKLEKELGMVIRTNQSEEQPLQERLNTLKSDLERYCRIRNLRIERLASLKAKENALCSCLMEAILDIKEEVPSEQQLEELESRISMLKLLKADRQEELHSTRLRVASILSNLELSPANEFEKLFLESDDDWNQLTPEIMERIQNVEKKYVAVEYEKKEQVESLKKKLIRLMDQIDTSQEARQEFFGSLIGIGQSVEKKLSKEIARCETIRRENLVPIIEKLRTEISDLWDTLTYTDEQRSEFRAYLTNVYNEDVLDLHEMEKYKLEELYNSNKHIYEMAAKREKLRIRMAHLVAQMTNPKRLKNRGGQLLKEERERKSLEKNLPVIDSNLKQALVDYYTARGTSFLWYGEDLLQKMLKEKENCGNYNMTLSKSPRVNRRALTVHRRSRSFHNLTEESVANYSQFQDAIDSVRSGQLGMFTPQPVGHRTPLTPRTQSVSRLPISQARCTPVGTPRRVLKRAHSSPTIVGNKLTPFKSRKVDNSKRLCTSAKKNVEHF